MPEGCNSSSKVIVSASKAMSEARTLFMPRVVPSNSRCVKAMRSATVDAEAPWPPLGPRTIGRLLHRLLQLERLAVEHDPLLVADLDAGVDEDAVALVTGPQAERDVLAHLVTRSRHPGALHEP